MNKLIFNFLGSNRAIHYYGAPQNPHATLFMLVSFREPSHFTVAWDSEVRHTVSIPAANATLRLAGIQPKGYE